MTSYARRLRETGWLSMNAKNSDLKRVQELYADRAIIWASIEYDFPELEQFCIAYCEERGCPIN